jgi:hypothetical protein
VKEAESQGGLRLFRERGALVGYVAYWHDRDAWYGTPTTMGLIELVPDRHDLVERAVDDFKERSPGLGDALDITLDAHDVLMINGLIEEGLSPDAAVLVGCPRRSLERLRRLKDPPDDLEHLGLRLSPMDSEEKVHAAMDLKRKVFRDEPSRCWFYEFVAEQERAEILRCLRSGELGDRFCVILDGDQTVGMFGYSFEEQNPNWGATAGMDLVLDPLIQGKGVVKTSYLRMLASMVAEGVDAYKGGTNQPAVMGLSCLMERDVYAYVLRRETPFRWEHFSLLSDNAKRC